MGGLDRMIDRQEREGTMTGDADADALLREDANAVLIGALLDQRVRAEVAFTGPLKLKQRLGHFDLARIASMDAEAFQEVFGEQPAVHSFKNMMAGRTQQLAAALVDRYDGDAARMWADDPDETTLKKRLSELPGFGPSKVKMVPVALKRFGHL